MTYSDVECGEYGECIEVHYTDIFLNRAKIVSEYDQQIPQSQIEGKPMAPRGRATQPARDTRKTI